MSEASWLCENKGCRIMFQWHPSTQKAVYGLGNKTKSVAVPGITKPSRCPECGGKKIESLEG